MVILEPVIHILEIKWRAIKLVQGGFIRNFVRFQREIDALITVTFYCSICAFDGYRSL